MSLFNKLSAYNRKRKYGYFIKTLAPCNSQTILDVGFTYNDYSAEANYLEKHYPYQQNITALGLKLTISTNNFQSLYPQVTVVTYDGNIYPFSNNQFDIGWSNAVIEHVGERKKQVLFVKELLRTCDVVFLTTPNRWFPFDLHTKIPFIHWLPKKYFNKSLIFFGQEWASGDYLNLLGKKNIINICEEAGAKFIKIKRNRLFGFTMDFSIIASLQDDIKPYKESSK